MTETYAQEFRASTPVASAVRSLIAAGCDPVIAATVAAVLFAAGMTAAPAEIRVPPADATAEKRRAYDRERARIRRENERGGTRKSADSPRTPKVALSSSLSKDSDSQGRKKERAAQKTICPMEFQPTEKNLAYGASLGMSAAAVLGMAREMQEWSASSGNKKLDWPLTLNVWMRRKSNERKSTNEKSTVAAADRLIAAAQRGEFHIAPKPDSNFGFGPRPRLAPVDGSANPRLLSQG